MSGGLFYAQKADDEADDGGDSEEVVEEFKEFLDNISPEDFES